MNASFNNMITYYKMVTSNDEKKKERKQLSPNIENKVEFLSISFLSSLMSHEDGWGEAFTY